MGFFILFIVAQKYIDVILFL